MARLHTLWTPTAVLPAADVRVQADQADGDDPAREDDVLPGPAPPIQSGGQRAEGATGEVAGVALAHLMHAKLVRNPPDRN